MRIKVVILALVLLVVFLSFSLAAEEVPQTTALQSDEYNVFIPFVVSSRCYLPESTKAECLQ